jgi:hypothetical protein
MGSGSALLDYDADGWLDILCVNGGTTVTSSSTTQPRHALYHNLRNGKFEDVTVQAGLGQNRYYGMGVAVGDYDNDGYPDLYITSFGPNTFYHNNGNGTFTDVTSEAGVECPDWSTSAAFFDLDRDGLLDLYVANYVDAAPENNPVCILKGVRAYCHPSQYRGVSDRLYKNLGNGRFRDISVASGIHNSKGKGLGVSAADFDGDGWVDIYVANDSVGNFLYKNNRNGTFTDVTMASGTGYNGEGQPEASMGVAVGDYNRDGKPDIFVTNYDTETNAFYRNDGNLVFTDVRWSSGVAALDHFWLGFGTGFLDFDNDGDLDLLIVNGHVIDNIEAIQPEFRYAQPLQLLENQNDKFVENAAFGRYASGHPRVGRGACFGDIDNDGDIDVVVTNSGEKPTLLINRCDGSNHWILLKLIGTQSNGDAVGATVQVVTEQGVQTSQIAGGGSYLSAGDLRLHFGLGSSKVIQSLIIRWPDGLEETKHNVAVNQILSIVERNLR